jgi:hypothetical protein
MMRFLLANQRPFIGNEEADFYSKGLAEYAVGAGYEVSEGTTVAGQYLPIILKDRIGQKIGLWVKHPLQAQPSTNLTQSILSQSGIKPAIHTSFDLERRPFWVIQNLFHDPTR